jgi:hypothetical protein
MDGCILYKDQYQLLWKSSWFTLISFIYAIYKQQYYLSISPGIVFITSINYWRKPDYSWRRYLDMTCVKCGFLYHLIRAYNAQYNKEYYTIVFFAASCYPIGIYYYDKKLYWHSTYAHCMLHIIANISNIVLYSGYIDPLLE